MKNILTTLTVATFSIAGVTGLHAQRDNMEGGNKMGAEDKMEAADSSKENIVEIASGMNNFTTLVAAVKAADLAETLSGDGPFTVFAPTNDAFDELPEGTVEELLKPENKEKLQKILKFHVVPGKVMAADVKTMSAGTAAGEDAAVVVEDGVVTYAGQKVIKTDIVASNGVIHWIDGVAMPEM
ncbi:fasciclin domain-containing protein [Luteolibacter sp. AS25]